ncbi:MAG: tripartite tricarboxylate transporter substrate binding protein [Microvirga sp.]|nr:tripartite tricarboxylate transporter substrate binding protein [Microvirga sp.]
MSGYEVTGDKFSRRQVLAGGLGAMALTMTSSGLLAQQAFPSNTIELLVHAGAGGGTDLTAHALIAGGRSELGWQMALVRKTGAGGAVSHEYARSRPADGHTVIVLTSSQLSVIARGKSPLTIDDLAGVGRGTVDPIYLMVSANGPYKTAQDFIEAGKSKSMSVGLVSIGGGDHITTFLLARAAGMSPMQAVPIASGGEVTINIVGGNLDSGMVGVSEAEAQIRSGAVRPLINFGEARTPELPDVPTARELGIDLVRPTLRGFAVLKSTPEPVLATLRDGFMTAMKSEPFQSYLTNSGQPLDSVASGEEFERSMRREHDEAKIALTELGLM